MLARSTKITLRCTLLLGMGACGDGHAPLAPTRVASTSAEQLTGGPSSRFQTPDDEWARFAREEMHGFAGVVIESAGSTLLLSDTSGQVTKLAYAKKRFSELGHGRAPTRIRKVANDFATLKDVFDRIVQLDLRNVNFTMLDIDEARNIVVMGVARPNDQGPARRIIAQSGIQPSLVDVIVQRRAVYPVRQVMCAEGDSTCYVNGGGGSGTGVNPSLGPLRSGAPTSCVGLQCSFQNMYAGLELSFVDATSHEWACTNGGMATLAGHMGVITGSHCFTNRQGELDYTLFWQGPQGQNIAQKSVDPPYKRSDANLDYSSCPAFYQCRYSDAQFADWIPSSGRTFGFGYIAAPTYQNEPDEVRRIRYEDGTVYRIVEERRPPLVALQLGAVVYKVGRTTGTTTGYVSGTCQLEMVTNRVGQNIGQLCQYVVTGNSGVSVVEPGDSGGPVFTGYGGGNQVMFEGILSVKYDDGSNRYAFSPFESINYELHSAVASSAAFLYLH